LLSVVDAHPELRASGEFQMIAQTIENVEDSLTNAWRRYNSSVRDYNRSIRVFPGNLLAILLGLRPKPLLGVPPKDEPASMAAAPRATT
jgi:LemA protein